MSETGFISLDSHPNPVADWLEEISRKNEDLAFFQRNSDLGDILLTILRTELRKHNRVVS